MALVWEGRAGLTSWAHDKGQGELYLLFMALAAPTREGAAQLALPCPRVTPELPPVHSSDGIPEAAQQGVHVEAVHPFPLLNAEPQQGRESSILHNPNVL